MEKPTWILDIERTTGLSCEFDRQVLATQYWFVVTPNGLRLLRVYGYGDSEIGGCTWPSLYSLTGTDPPTFG
jgi:hypothetical protein